MYKPPTPWKSYRQVALQTAPPGQLILMLFDGALLSLEKALLGFKVTDPCERNTLIHNNLQRGLDIIRELNASLNLEAGGELASTLRDLYLYFESRLLQSNLKKNRSGLDEVLIHLTELRNAWAKMLAKEGQPVAPENEVWVNPDLRAA